MNLEEKEDVKTIKDTKNETSSTKEEKILQHVSTEMLQYENTMETEEDLENLSKSNVFYKVRLFKDLDLEKNVIGFSVWQVSNHLKTKNNSNYGHKFIPSKVKLSLKSVDFEHKKTFVSTNPCLLIDYEVAPKMKSGVYMLKITYLWNELAQDNNQLKQVTVAVTSPVPITLTRIARPT